MSARCAYGRCVNAREDEEEVHEKKRADARALFEAYLKKYPQGRFVADACGWLGDLVDDPATALSYFIRQVEAPGHPEVRKAALFMCERVLSDAPMDDEKTFALAAAHPTIAMGLTYLVMNSPYAPDEKEDHPPVDEIVSTQNESARAKKWRQKVLPRLAAQVAARKEAYQSDPWEPRYLAILAQAASAAGNSEQALQLTEMSPARNDDLLLARGVALQRAGRLPDAVSAYRTLIETFPQSPLAKGVRLKIALALQDDHHAGLAIVELQRLLPKEEKQEFDAESIYPPADSELEFTASVRSPRIFPGRKRSKSASSSTRCITLRRLPRLRKSRQRQISRKRSARMRGRSSPNDTSQRRSFARRRSICRPRSTRLWPPDWKRRPLAAEAPGDARAKAAAMLAVGDAWAGARGKLLRLPLDSQKTTSVVFNGYSDEAGLRRRANGKALGLKDVDGTLEDRDELRHASRWWMRAARALPGSPLAAGARWKAMDAMPKLAVASSFASQLASETDAAAVSRELYDRLRSEVPDSVEARQYAVYWNFPKLLEWRGFAGEGVSTEDRGVRRPRLSVW